MANESKTYHRWQLRLGLLGFALSAAYLIVVVAFDLGAIVDHWARSLGNPLPWRVAVVAAAIVVGQTVLGFPLGWLRAFWLPTRYGLLHQSFGAWLVDRGKAALIGGVLGLLAVEIVYTLMATTPRWWLVAAGALVALEISVAFVFPVWLMPLFYRLTPLADETLRRRLLDLATRAGIAVIGVGVADHSRKSRTANAALAGLGRTRRVILFDTLVARFAAPEIGAVLAHELGHHAHRDVWRMLGVQAGLTVLALWLGDVLLRVGVAWWGWQAIWDPAGLPWLALVIATLGVVTAPLVNGFSRHVERQADDFALDVTGDAAGFIGAMERLADLNLAERRPHRLKELLLYSHPSIDRRISRAEALRRPAR